MNVKHAFKTALMRTMVPIYRATDRQFVTTVDSSGLATVSHRRTAKANLEAAQRDLEQGKPLAYAKDMSDAAFHGSWALFNRVTGFDRWIGMD